MTEEELTRLERVVARNASAIESTQQQLELLTRQVQAMVPVQSSNSNRLGSAERNIQGIYDLLGTLAREQAERSQLIDQQIQSLIDERRRS